MTMMSNTPANNNNDNGVHGPSIKDDLEQTRKQAKEEAHARLKKLVSEMTREGII